MAMVDSGIEGAKKKEAGAVQAQVKREKPGCVTKVGKRHVVSEGRKEAVYEYTTWSGR